VTMLFRANAAACIRTSNQIDGADARRAAMRAKGANGAR
jgi:hypothetical protein